MYFLVKPNWERLNKDIWNSLRGLVSFREDIYVELLRYRFSLISHDELYRQENVEMLNDSSRAKERFRKLPPPFDEQGCLRILEGYYHVLSQFPTEIARKYYEKLAEWVNRHNLRYTITENCRFNLTIQGLLSTQIEFLKLHLSDRYSKERLEELESSVRYLRDVNDAKNMMRIASNLIEGILVDKAGNSKGTLSSALDSLPDLFPHRSMDLTLRSIYKFFSDYPNIRHPGNPSSSLRTLKMDDALLSVNLIIGFAAFVLDNNSSIQILNGTI